MTTVADFLRGVPTAADAVLREYLTHHDPEQDAMAHLGMATAALTELLRRKQEQCAAVCDALAAGYRALLETTDECECDSERADAFTRAAADIRRME